MSDETHSFLLPSQRNSARQRRALMVGFGVSLLVHLVLLFAFRSARITDPGSLAAGPRSGDVRAAAGGGEMTAITIVPPRPIEVPAPPQSTPLTFNPNIEAVRPEETVIAASLSGPAGAGREGAAGPGLARAVGAGDGGNDAQGSDQRTFPTPRSIIPRWDPPPELKGKKVTFRVHVDASGQPTGRIEVQPSIGDRGFEEKFRADLLSMDFLPGRRDGRAVADWAELTFTF